MLGPRLFTYLCFESPVHHGEAGQFKILRIHIIVNDHKIMNTVKSAMVKLSLIMLITAMSFTYLSPQASEKGSLVVKKCLDFDVTGDGSSSEWKKAEWVELKQKEPIKSSYTARAKEIGRASCRERV